MSRREVEVADYLRLGMKSAEIAKHLGISPRTVERHLRHCYRKLRVPGRRELIETLSVGEETQRCRQS